MPRQYTDPALDDNEECSCSTQEPSQRIVATEEILSFMNGIIYLEPHGFGNDEPYSYVKKEIMRAYHNDHGTSEEKPITIFINSPGGSVNEALGLYDQIMWMRKKYDLYVITIAQGYAFSGGAIVLQAGTERRITKNSYLMMHDVQSAGIEGDTKALENEVAIVKKMRASVLGILCSNLKMTNKKLQKILDEKGEWYMTANEALKFGLVDEVI